VDVEVQWAASAAVVVALVGDEVEGLIAATAHHGVEEGGFPWLANFARLTEVIGSIAAVGVLVVVAAIGTRRTSERHALSGRGHSNIRLAVFIGNDPSNSLAVSASLSSNAERMRITI
jgi:hypothetical protein